MVTVTADDLDIASDQLLRRVGRGDEAALDLIYRQFAPLAYGIALRVTGDEHLAQDVLQEVFADIWTNAHKFDSALASARSWVAMLAHRRAVDRVRRESSDRQRAHRWTSQSHTREHDEVAERVHIRAEHSEVRTALSDLSHVQREALHLAFFEGLTHSEVASRLDIPLGTAKTRIRDALRSLRTGLEVQR